MENEFLNSFYNQLNRQFPQEYANSIRYLLTNDNYAKEDFVNLIENGPSDEFNDVNFVDFESSEFKPINNLKLDSLRVKAFRGIKYEETLKFSNLINVLCGVNGSGKSSFVNALEYLFSNKVQSLNARAIKKDSVFNKDSNPDDLEIELKFNNGLYIKRTYDSFDYSPELDCYLTPFMKGSYFVLNRFKLLEFISNTPGKRYAMIMGLCGLDDINKVDESLSQTLKLFNSEKDNLNKELDKSLKEICSLLDVEKYEDIWIQLNNLLSQTNNPTVPEKSDLSKVLDDLNKTDFNLLIKYIDEFKQFNFNIPVLNEDFINLVKQYEKLSLSQFENLTYLIETLNASKKYLELENPDKCPVCDSNIDSNKILSKINKNIKVKEDKLANFDIWKKDNEVLCNHLNSLRSDFDKIIGILDNLNKLDDALDFTYDFSKEFKLISETIDYLKGFSKFESLVSDLNNFDLLKLNDSLELCNSKILDYENKLKESNDINKLDLIKKVVIKLIKYNELIDEIKLADNKKELSENTYNLFNGMKNNYINSIIDEIKGDVCKYFNFIHGKDEIISPNFETANREISLSLDAFGIKSDPRAFSSEGHLDTLGLCLFLGFVKKFNKFPFIVLDDIVATVDLPHKHKIIRLLLEEFKEYTFLITTHNNVWAEQIKRLYSSEKINVKVSEIVSWNLKEGPVIIPTKDYEERMDMYLTVESFDKNASANAGRRYLESIFKEFAELNRVKLPILDHYMLGDLYPAVKSFIIEHVEKTEFEDYYKNLFKEYEKFEFIANYLSHYNKDSDQLTKEEVEEFRDCVKMIKKALTCPNCGNTHYIIFDGNNKIIKCDNEKCVFMLDLIKTSDETPKQEHDLNELKKKAINRLAGYIRDIDRSFGVIGKDSNLEIIFPKIKSVILDSIKGTELEEYYTNAFIKIESTLLLNTYLNDKEKFDKLTESDLNDFEIDLQDFKKCFICEKCKKDRFLEFDIENKSLLCKKKSHSLSFN